MKKADSLRKLESWGFNVQEWIEITPHWASSITLRDFSLAVETVIGSMGPWSIRSELPDTERWDFPFFYGVCEMLDLWRECQRLGREGYHMVVYRTVDAQDSLGCGCVLVDSRLYPKVDFYPGPGTLRWAQKSKTPVVIEDGYKLRDTTETMVADVIVPQCVSKIPGIERPCIVEFSLYPYGVGKLNVEDIWWEIRCA